MDVTDKQSSRGLCDSTMNFHTTFHNFTNYLTVGRKKLMNHLSKHHLCALCEERACGTTWCGVSKELEFFKRDPKLQWLLSSATGARKAAICLHTCLLAGMVLISSSSLALSVAWMCATVYADGHPTPKNSEFFEGRGSLKSIVTTSDLVYTMCTIVTRNS